MRGTRNQFERTKETSGDKSGRDKRIRKEFDGMKYTTKMRKEIE